MLASVSNINVQTDTMSSGRPEVDSVLLSSSRAWAGVAVLAQESPKDVLDLESGYRRFDPVAGHVADHHRQSSGAGGKDIVEISRHHPRTSLVNTAYIEALVHRQRFRGQAGRPATGSELILCQDFFGSPLQLRTLLGQARFTQQTRCVPDRKYRRHTHAQYQQLKPRRGGKRSQDEPAAEHGIKDGGVKVLVESAPR